MTELPPKTLLTKDRLVLSELRRIFQETFPDGGPVCPSTLPPVLSPDYAGMEVRLLAMDCDAADGLRRTFIFSLPSATTSRAPRPRQDLGTCSMVPRTLSNRSLPPWTCVSESLLKPVQYRYARNRKRPFCSLPTEEGEPVHYLFHWGRAGRGDGSGYRERQGAPRYHGTSCYQRDARRVGRTRSNPLELPACA